MLCHQCGAEQVVTAQGLMDLIDFSPYGTRRSNARNQSEDVGQNFESFVFDCEGIWLIVYTLKYIKFTKMLIMFSIF